METLYFERDGIVIEMDYETDTGIAIIWHAYTLPSGAGGCEAVGVCNVLRDDVAVIAGCIVLALVAAGM